MSSIDVQTLAPGAIHEGAIRWKRKEKVRHASTCANTHTSPFSIPSRSAISRGTLLEVVVCLNTIQRR